MSEENNAPAPIDTTGQKLNVTNCPSCDAPHQDLEISSFNKHTPPWTHWFTCPSTGDPVPLTLVMVDPKSGIEVNNVIIRNLVHAQQRGAYMVSIFRIEDGQVKLDRTTFNFPTGDFVNCISLLKADLEREIGPPQAVPLKDADDQAPLVNLFGNPGGGS